MLTGALKTFFFQLNNNFCPVPFHFCFPKDESGSLERPEIVRALIKTIPEFTGRDEGWLEGTFAAIWSIIDPNQDGERAVTRM